MDENESTERIGIHERGYLRSSGFDSYEYNVVDISELFSSPYATFAINYGHNDIILCEEEIRILHEAMSEFLKAKEEFDKRYNEDRLCT